MGDVEDSPAGHGPNVISIHPYQRHATPAVIIPATDVSNARVLSYQDLHLAIVNLQVGLGNIGVDTNSRVALALPNGIEFVTSFLAVVAQRATVAPINPDYGQNECHACLQRIQPSVLLVSTPNAAVLAAQGLSIPVVICVWDDDAVQVSFSQVYNGPMPRPVPAATLESVSPDDDALMLFTSGTTGTPKGVLLTHRNLLVAVRIHVRSQRLIPTDRCALITPLFHVAGLGASLLPTLLSGGAVVIPPSLFGGFWDQLREHAVTWYHAVPTLHRLLLGFPRPAVIPPLRFVRSGGSSLAQDTRDQLEMVLKVPVVEIYGMTETAPGIFSNTVDHPGRTSCYPVPDEVVVRILLVDSNGASRLTDQTEVAGEICLQGPSIMSGYMDDEDSNAASFINGFFRTGDIGMLEPGTQGSGLSLRLTGRIKEVINKGGEKIDPTEIEQVLLRYGAVRDVACFRVSDESYGENIGISFVPFSRPSSSRYI